MNGKDLLITLGDINHKYYDEAENEAIKSNQKHLTLRKPVLVAAIITVMMFLMGCAVVALKLQDMSIGKETYTQHFNNEGLAIEPTERERDVLTLFGHSGDNIQKATAEWFAFLETYDPNGELSDNNPDHQEIPNQYEYTYGCYTTDMAAKVDEIAAKYDLKLLEEWLPFQAWQSDIFFEETGIGSLVLENSGAEMTCLSGMFYPPYNFDVDIDLHVEGLENDIWMTVLYARKDYFPRDYPGGTDLSLYEQWDYTAADGTKLLLALSSKGHAYVIAEFENAMMILSVDGNYSTSAYPTAEEIMTKAELEAIADVMDYTIQPYIPDRSVVAKRLEESNKAYEAENTYVPETYGSFTDALKSTYATPTKDQYTFFDLTGDGEDELLLAFGNRGTIDQWFTVLDGEIQWFWGNDCYLCEGMVLEQYMPDPELDNAHHYYVEADSETAWMDTDPETWGDFIGVLLKTGDKWTYAPKLHSEEEKEITEAEAMEYMAQYPRIELDWKPVMDYPISETETFGDYIEAKDVRVSDEELLQIYKDYLKKREDRGDMYYSHYRILDINGDGVDDLLLKRENNALLGSTDYYGLALTFRYGIIEGIASDFYLCENGVLEHVDSRHTGGIGVERDGKEFVRYDGFDEATLDFVMYDKSVASWFTDWWAEEPISGEEANAIIAKYPRIDQGMRPIEEMLN